MDKQKIRGYCIVSAFTVVLYLALSNMDRLTGALRVAGGLLAPFFVGVAIAFILNNVMVLFEKKVFYRLAEGRNPRSARMVRPLSLVSTYLVTFAAFGVLLWVVVPQLAASVVTLGNNIPAYLESLRVLGNRLQGELTLPAEALEQISAWFSQAADVLLNFLVDFVPRMLGYVVSFGGGIVTFVIGIIVSIHLLMSKEKLLSQVGRLGRAFLPDRAADHLGGDDVAVDLLDDDHEEDVPQGAQGVDHEQEEDSRNRADKRPEEGDDVGDAHDDADQHRVGEAEDRKADHAHDPDDHRVQQLAGDIVAERLDRDPRRAAQPSGGPLGQEGDMVRAWWARRKGSK